MDTFGMVLRVVVSLAVVLALIWAFARVRKRVAPKGASALNIVSKVPVSKRGALLLVEIGDRTLLLGSTDESISLLTEVHVSSDEDAPKQQRTPVDFDTLLDEWRMPDDDLSTPRDEYLPIPQRDMDEALRANLPAPGERSPLAGSVLSPTTWRQLTQVLRERTVRS